MATAPSEPSSAAASIAAARLCEAPGETPGDIDPPTRLAIGWALKSACYAAWSSDPPRALRAAQALRSLCATSVDRDATLAALADWTEGIACLIRSEMAPALQALGRATEGWRALGEPLHAAHAQVPKLMALAVLGRFDEAQRCALDTEAALRAEGDEHAAAKVRLNLGSLAFSRDEHEQAVAHYRAAAVRFARVGDREHSVMADVGQADALSYLGRFDEALRHYRRAGMRALAHGLPVLAALADNGSAQLALTQGRYAEALAGLERSRRTLAELGLEHRRSEAEKSLADAYLEVRLLPEAIALYRALAGSLREQAALATLPWVQAQLARALALTGQPVAALAALTEAALGFDAQDNSAGRATVAAVQADLHAAAGRSRQALALALDACHGFATAGLHYHRAAARIQVAAARTACGDPALALVECEALLADAELAPQLRVRAQVESADALLALHRRDPARAMLERAIDGLEELRAVLPGEQLRRAFLADASRPYLRRLALALDDLPAAGGGAQGALQWLERFKARALQERLGFAPDPGLSQDRTSTALRERLDWLYRRQQRQVEDDGDAPPSLRDEAMRLEHQLLELGRRDRLVGAPDRAAIGPVAAVDIAALQLALGAGRALVEYGVVGDELFAVVVRHDRLDLHRRVASWSATRQAVQDLHFQIDAMRAGSAMPSAHLPALCARTQRRLVQVHALVWQALARDVGDCPQLLIVPHGPLHGVPFAALSDGTLALVDRHELVMAASAGVALAALVSTDDGAGAIGPALVVGDGSRLAHVAAELRAVSASFAQARLFEGPDASIAALRAAAPQAGLLHLACHARFRADSPLFSALHLADGALTADEVQGWRLNARLVVLSACESALGAAGVADEGVGLVRAFLMAGAKRVLGSHWSVDDAVTAEFMRLFYARWVGGDRLAAALGHAQRTLRASRPHPAHWAAFALHGAT